MSVGLDLLVGYQRAEFQRASSIRQWLLGIQVSLALIAASSVFIRDETVLFYFAILGFLLLLLWIVVDHSYRSHRSAGEHGRRASYIVGGLQYVLSPAEQLSLRSSFCVTESEAQAAASKDYFATKAATGPHRLGEMISESAFYTEKLHAKSAQYTMIFVSLTVLIFVVVSWSAVPFADVNFQIAVTRVFLAVLVFLLSSDVWGAASGHVAAWLAVKDVRKRLEAVEARDYPLADVLLVMSDYNAVVERAPMILPHVYNIHRKHLDDLWKTYEKACSDARAARAAGSHP